MKKRESDKEDPRGGASMPRLRSLIDGLDPATLVRADVSSIYLAALRDLAALEGDQFTAGTQKLILDAIKGLKETALGGKVNADPALAGFLEAMARKPAALSAPKDEEDSIEAVFEEGDA